MSTEINFESTYKEIQSSSVDELREKFKENPKLLDVALDILERGAQLSFMDRSIASKIRSAINWSDITNKTDLKFLKRAIFTGDYFIKRGEMIPDEEKLISTTLTTLRSLVTAQEKILMKDLLNKRDSCSDEELDQLVNFVTTYYDENEAIEILKTLRKFNFSEGSDTLSTMAEHEKYKCLSFVLQNKIGFTDINKVTAAIFGVAINENDKTLLNILSDTKASFNIVFRAPPFGKIVTPLLLAISKNNEEIIRHLVAKGAGINFVSDYTRSPLYETAYIQPIEMVKLILELGGDFRNEKVSVEELVLSDYIGMIDINKVILLFDKGLLSNFHFKDFNQFSMALKDVPINEKAILLLNLLYCNDVKELNTVSTVIQALRNLPEDERGKYIHIFKDLHSIEDYRKFADQWGKLYQQCGGKGPTLIPTLLIYNICKNNNHILSEEDLKKITDVLSQKEIGQPAIWNPLVKALTAMNAFEETDRMGFAGRINAVQKETLLNLFISNKPADLITTTSIYVALQSLGSLSDFNEATSLQELNETLIKVFSQYIGNQSIENFGEKYIKNISSMRMPEAFPLWLGNINKNLPIEFFEHASFYFETALEGQENFSKVRYDLDNNPHLAFIESQRPGLIQKWAQGSGKTNVADIINTMNISSEQTGLTAQDYCKHLLLEQRHLPLPEDNSKHLGHLKLYLEGKIEHKEALKKLAESIKSCQLEIKKTKDPKQKEELEKKRDFLKLEHLLINFADPKRKLGYEEHTLKLLENISTFVNDLYPKEPFEKDLKDFLSTKPEKHPIEYYQKLTIEDTDNYQDLFLCGTEVKGSCQSITGQPKINIGLASYGLNGHHRILPIKDESGKIVDRAFLTKKIEDDGKPALYLEGCYPYPAEDELLNNVITAYAIQRAKDLGLPLYAEDPAPDGTDTAQLEVKESLIPYVYDDAKGGGQIWGLPLKHPRGKALYIPPATI